MSKPEIFNNLYAYFLFISLYIVTIHLITILLFIRQFCVLWYKVCDNFYIKCNLYVVSLHNFTRYSFEIVRKYHIIKLTASHVCYMK